MSIRVPEIEIPVFNGKMASFQTFLELFSTVFDKNKIQEEQKLVHQMTKLTGYPFIYWKIVASANNWGDIGNNTSYIQTHMIWHKGEREWNGEREFKGEREWNGLLKAATWIYKPSLVPSALVKSKARAATSLPELKDRKAIQKIRTFGQILFH